MSCSECTKCVKTYQITGFKCKNPIRKKLLTMGLIPNTTLEVVRVAPLGDPIEIRVRGYMLSLRKEEFEQLNLKSA